MSEPYAYFLGLGSNLQPQHHVSTALKNLHAEFGRLVVWPVVETQPVDMHSEKVFYNSLVILLSPWPAKQLKAWTNALEISCGRDRLDPLRRQKDRALDIDILAQQREFDLAIVEQFHEPYIQSVLRAAGSSIERAHLTCQRITLAGQALGQRPAAIDTDHTGGHIVIIEDSVDRLCQSFETTLNREQSFC